MVVRPSPGSGRYDEAVARQRARNAHGDRDWDLFWGHRERLGAVLTSAARGGSLIVLGAGNGNDLDFERLATSFTEVHLADLDEAALARARDRQSERVKRRLTCHAPVDLTGDLLRLAERWRQGAAAPAALSAALETSSVTLARRLPYDADVVVSACVLSQIFLAAAEVLGDGHPQLAPLCRALTQLHLRAATLAARPGGHVVFALDVTSNDLAPEMTSSVGLASVLDRALEQGRYFLGSHPQQIEALFREDPVLRREAEAPRHLEPWLWSVSEDVLFLVSGMVWRRTDPPDEQG